METRGEGQDRFTDKALDETVLTRRQAMALSAAAGVAATGAGALGLPSLAAAATPPNYAPPLKNVPAPPVPLFSDQTITFQTLFALGNISAASGEYGEIVTVVKRVQDRGESYLAFYEEFLAEARAVNRYADNAARRGRRITARNAYLRAASYYGQSLFFALILASDSVITAMASGGAVPSSARARERGVYRLMRNAWEDAGRQMRPRMQVVKLKWDGPKSPMPGWFLRPSDDGKRRPTLLMNNGSDAQAIDLWGAGGYAALERGWNVLIFDGPGEGGMLFEKDQTFVPQWEKVITPIVSWLRGRSDVDRDRIALSGSSFGGELVPRAAAYESRLAAISVDPGVVYAGSTWTDGLATFPGQLEAFEAGNKELFNSNWAGYAAGLSLNERFGLAKRLEIYPGTTMFEKYSQIVQYDNRSVLSRIRKPMLVINNEVEQFFPGQAKALYDLLTRSRGKKYVTFTVSEGAQFHCEPMAPQRRNDTVMDFFDDAVGR
ncbi:MAG: alpha/beta hydrolase family protein [Solirubrobacterales bacterium]